MKKTQINGKISCVHRLDKLIVLKYPTYSKTVYRFSAIPIKISVTFFVDTDKITLKIIWDGKGTRTAEKKSGKLVYVISRLFKKITTVIKTA